MGAQSLEQDILRLQSTKSSVSSALPQEMESPSIDEMFQTQHDARRDPLRWIRPPAAHLNDADLHYVFLRHGLDLLTPGLRRILLEAYIEYVFPLMPIADLQDATLAVSQSQDGSEQIGLTVLQSIYLLGALYAQAEALREGGFFSRTTAIKTIYARVKLLSDLGYESDPLEALQVALNMVFYFEEINEHIMKHKWLLTALGIAQRINLAAAEYDSELRSNKDLHLRRRLRWALDVNSKTALTTASLQGLPSFVCSEAPVVRQNDLDFSLLPENVRKLLLGNTLLLTTDLEKKVADACSSFASLSSLIPEIFACDAILSGKGHDEHTSHIRSSALTTSYLQIEKELQVWSKSQPWEFRAGPRHICPSRHSGGATVLEVQRAFLRVTYFTLCMDLEKRMAVVNDSAIASIRHHLDVPLVRLRHEIRSILFVIDDEVLRKNFPSQLHCPVCRTIFKTLNMMGAGFHQLKNPEVEPECTTARRPDQSFTLPSPSSDEAAEELLKPEFEPNTNRKKPRHSSWGALTPVSQNVSVSAVYQGAQALDDHRDYILMPEMSATPGSTPILPSSLSDLDQYVDLNAIIT